jgi:hypothetical protein
MLAELYGSARNAEAAAARIVAAIRKLGDQEDQEVRRKADRSVSNACDR